MKHLLRRRDTEALLRGEAIAEDSGLDAVDAFLTGMRVEFGATPAPAPRPTLAATLDGRRALRPASGPFPKPTFPVARPRGHLLRPVAAVFATGAVMFGGLASAGALPGPAQRAAAELGSHLGIHLPGRVSPAGPGTGVTDDPPRPSAGTNPTTSTTSSAAPTTPTVVGGLPAPTVPGRTGPKEPALPTLPSLPTPSIPSPTRPLPDVGLPGIVPVIPGLTGTTTPSGVLPGPPSP